ncbi:hypothetical protein Tco_0820989 [Tanacetum coccineum]|uniref:Uncharacterized protein n=1 Tax=Tanacetum coccineum TaxID=301880 RepID=A0ABQ5AB16_9ASTR
MVQSWQDNKLNQDVDTLSIDDLYNNLRVFEREIQEDWDLLHEDLEQIDDLDIEWMDINWKIAMIAIRMKKFYKKLTDGRVDNVPQRGHIRKEEEKTHFLSTPKKMESKEKINGLLTMDDGNCPIVAKY